MISQQLGSARGVGLGALTVLTNDIYSIGWNPAGLSSLQDWDVGISNFLPTTQQQSGITLHSLSIGKRFLSNHTASFCYSPGKILEFIEPATFDVIDSSGNLLTTKFDKKISYHQRYSIGYSYRVEENIAVGISAKFFETNISDTKYFFDSSYIIHSQIDEHAANAWTFDIGGIYKTKSAWAFGIVTKNLFQLNESELKDEMREYKLNLDKLAILGIAYEGLISWKLAAEGDTKKNFRIGAEWIPVDWLQIRTGMYSRELESIEALSFGFGFTYARAHIDVGYIRFSDQTNRSGNVEIGIFKTSSFADIDYTPFTKDQISLSLDVNLGITKEPLARIEYVEMLSEVFTASPQIYAFRPLGKARVKNVTSKSIDVRVSFYLEEFMNAPTETKTYTIPSEEILEVPFFAVFNEAIAGVKKFSVYDGTVFVNAEISSDYDDRYQTRVLVRGRNDWDGDVMLLKYFVTPGDPDVLQFSRSVLNEQKTRLDKVATELQNFEKAKIIFNEFSRRLTYVHDPQSSKDFVQYTSETLSLHGGDCDDITVGFSSLLMSVGISTAFVDIVPPEQPDNAHIYMMFDTGLSPKDAYMISENPKRYITRNNDKGIESIWIPIETTVSSKGFDEAWSTGAYQYLQDAEVNFGLIKGWMRVVDLQSTF